MPGQDEKTPIELRQDVAYERTLQKYRHFHFTWLDTGKRRPMPATAALVELAKIRIFAPRSRNRPILPGGGAYEIALDDHCWLTINQRAWRIVTIEGGILFLDSFGDQMQLGPYAREKWEKYVDKALDALRAAYPI